MRADERLKDVPVVVVTAHSQVADNLAVEPDLVLLKPVSLSQLSNLVQRLRNTPLSMPEAPWDPITHLYNRGFFSVRLSYSLEQREAIGRKPVRGDLRGPGAVRRVEEGSSARRSRRAAARDRRALEDDPAAHRHRVREPMRACS